MKYKVAIVVPGDDRIANSQVPRFRERYYNTVEHQGLRCAFSSRCTWHDFEKA